MQDLQEYIREFMDRPFRKTGLQKQNFPGTHSVRHLPQKESGPV